MVVMKIKSDNRCYLRLLFRFNTDHFFTQPISPSGNPIDLETNMLPQPITFTVSTLFKLPPSSLQNSTSLLTGLCACP